MFQKGRGGWLFVLSLVVLIGAMPAAAQAKGLLVPGSQGATGHDPTIPAECRGLITQVTDIGFEGVKTTAQNFSSATGGGALRGWPSCARSRSWC